MSMTSPPRCSNMDARRAQLFLLVAAIGREPRQLRRETKNVRDQISALRIGVTLAILVACNSLGASLAVAQARSDPMLNNLPMWDANHDGIYTCDEWKIHVTTLFNKADRNHDGYLTAEEFATIKRAEPLFAMPFKRFGMRPIKGLALQ